MYVAPLNRMFNIQVYDSNFGSMKYTPLASLPGPTQLSIAFSTEKRGEPGIVSNVSIT